MKNEIFSFLFLVFETSSNLYMVYCSNRLYTEETEVVRTTFCIKIFCFPRILETSLLTCRWQLFETFATVTVMY